MNGGGQPAPGARRLRGVRSRCRCCCCCNNTLDTVRQLARTGGNLGRADSSCAPKGPSAAPARAAALAPSGFSKISAPALASTRETLRSRDDNHLARNLRCAVAPVKRGGGPRVLGRAARLTEGPEAPVRPSVRPSRASRSPSLSPGTPGRVRRAEWSRGTDVDDDGPRGS